MADEIEGLVARYSAQGMEGEAWLVFQERAHVRRGADGSEAWAMEGMHRLEAGGRLTIVAPDGGVLWSGTLAWRRAGALGLLGPYTLAPPGIEPARWEAWFDHEPPLTARYAPPRGGARGQ